MNHLLVEKFLFLVISQLATNEARAKKENMLFEHPEVLFSSIEEHRLFDIVGMASLDDLSKPPVKKQRVKVAFADKATKIIDK